MKFNNILHITDDYLYFKNKKNKEIIKYKLPDRTVYGGKISNTKKFIKSFEKLLNANHLILTNHSAYQLIFIIQAYLLCVLLYSSLNRASSLTLLARPLGPTLVITSNITRSISIGTPTVIILERVSVNTAFCKGEFFTFWYLAELIMLTRLLFISSLTLSVLDCIA